MLTGAVPFEADTALAVITQHLYAPPVPARARNAHIPAALDELISRMLSKEPDYRDQLAACYTFGSPRVGDGKYENRLKVPVYRMVHAADIVTLIPFFFGTYVHVGDPRYLSRNVKGRILYRGIPTVRRTWEAALEMLLALLHFRNPLFIWIEAHNMAHYIWKLKRIAKAKNTF